MLKEFKLKVYGGRFILEFDCLPLKGMINNPDVIDPTIMRWTAYIRLFDFDWRHVTGKSMKVSDFLSRRPLTQEEIDKDWEMEESKVEEDIEAMVFNSERLDEVPEEIKVISEFLKDFQVPASVDPLKRKSFIRKCSKYFLKDGYLFRRPLLRTGIVTI
jgi:hypothetical protein